MYIFDAIYGGFEIDEPVLQRIIKSKTFQRLIDINMGSWCPKNPFLSAGYNRYEHSIGVFLLLRKYGASIQEQIAGLIHDVSHSAFSHLSDRLFGDAASAQTSEYQDSIHDNFVKNSEIAEILEQYGYDVDQILDDRNFPLKENSLPDLCADRMDYGLRATLHLKRYGHMLDIDVCDLANQFVVTNGGFVMRDLDSARKFAKTFNFADEHIYSCFDNVFFETMMTETCRDALTHGALCSDDFWRLTDGQILKKMADAGIDFSKMYRNPNDWRADPTDATAQTEFQKVRRIDPPFVDTDGTIKRLSDVDADYAKYIAEQPAFFEYKIKK